MTILAEIGVNYGNCGAKRLMAGSVNAVNATHDIGLAQTDNIVNQSNCTLSVLTRITNHC